MFHVEHQNKEINKLLPFLIKIQLFHVEQLIKYK